MKHSACERFSRSCTAARVCCALFALLGFASTASAVGVPTTLPRLATCGPGSASSIRGSWKAENAFDGKFATRWCTNDTRNPSWLMVDLGEPRALAGCEIRWERELVYQCIIEGSADGKTWSPLNDQTGTDDRSLVRCLLLSGAPARYVRVYVTKVEGNGWASICELRLFDAAAMKQLSDAEQRQFVGPTPHFADLAYNRPIVASSVQGGNIPANAVDDDPKTRWCASDVSKPQWLEVDLESIKALDEIQVRWEHPKAYRCVIEGSLDNVEWQVLVDQRDNSEDQQVQKFSVRGKHARYVRVTVTGVTDEGTWASINDLKITEPK